MLQVLSSAHDSMLLLLLFRAELGTLNNVLVVLLVIEVREGGWPVGLVSLVTLVTLTCEVMMTYSAHDAFMHADQGQLAAPGHLLSASLLVASMMPPEPLPSMQVPPC
jgi:hypothetical protein